jgi:hypothetical protein
MRTLIRVKLKNPKAIQDIENWLMECDFNPTTIYFSEEDRKIIIDNPLQPNGESNPLISSAVARKVTRILGTIPCEEEERATAIHTAKWSVDFTDPILVRISGIVCIQDRYMTVRLRHQISKSLEAATEELIKKIINREDLFEKLENFKIPVREPGSTSNAYIGLVCLPADPALKQKAKQDKFLERKTAYLSIIAMTVFSVVGFYLFFISSSDTGLRWVSGFFDRFATTFAATAALSFANYKFYLSKLKNQPIISWKQEKLS